MKLTINTDLRIKHEDGEFHLFNQRGVLLASCKSLDDIKQSITIIFEKMGITLHPLDIRIGESLLPQVPKSEYHPTTGAQK